jgi:leader peptidase (prepilin peptidase)/N-methyltransferase
VDAAAVALDAWLVLVCAVAVPIDLERRIVPNRLTAAGALLALAIGTVLDPSGEPGRLLAGAGAGGFLLAAALVDPAGMGLGDVKLAGVMGLCLGGAVAVALVAALAAGALYGLGVLVRRGPRACRTATLPFAPCLALGSLAAIGAELG